MIKFFTAVEEVQRVRRGFKFSGQTDTLQKMDSNTLEEAVGITKRIMKVDEESKTKIVNFLNHKLYS